MAQLVRVIFVISSSITYTKYIILTNRVKTKEKYVLHN